MIGSRLRRRFALLALLGALSTTVPAAAGTTRAFRQTSARDFEEGEATAAMVLPSGEVVAGMKATRLPLDAAFVWCSARSPDGRTVYFGTGDEGGIYAAPAAGDATGAPKKLAQVDASWVTSLAVRPDGVVLAGTTPGGRIFAIDPKSGAARSFAKIGAEHVWALIHDPQRAVTYAAGGGDGKLFTIDAKGGASLLWSSGDKQITSIAAAPDGTLLAGTSEQAIVYRVHPNGRAEALHDFDADEVRAIARSSRGLFLAVNDFDRANLETPPPGATAPAAAKGTRIAASGAAPVSVGGARAGQLKSRSAVYRIAEDGAAEQVFTLSDGYLTALSPQANGDVLAASGTQGKVYRLFADRSFALVADLPERQILTIAPTEEALLVGTGDIGGVYRVRPSAAGEAFYLSKVFDADVFARFGQLRWSGSPDLVFATRSGNTARPDKSWGDWTKLGGVVTGGGEGEGKVGSAPARYVQHRVQLPSRTSSLREATLFYLPQNLRPRVTEVTLAEASASAGASAASTAPPSPRSTVLRLRFRVDNPDGDELIYRVRVRQENESVWRSVGSAEPLTRPELDWNTESFPDGRYVVQVWVSDEASTPAPRALDSTFTSSPFLVDNGKPDVVALSAKPPLVTGRVQDATSPIKTIECSLDGGPWRLIAPTDAILDQRSETFSVQIPPSTPRGPHVLTVRALDAADNVGTARVQFELK